MSRTKLETFSPEEQRKLLRKFFIAITALDNYQSAADFLRDLLNRDELAMLARRLKVAQLLEQGLTYEEISAQMHVGFDTIGRVNYWLHYGTGGYKKIVKLLNKVEKNDEVKRIRKARESQPFSLAWVQKRYGKVTAGDLQDLINDFNNFIRKIKRHHSLYKE